MLRITYPEPQRTPLRLVPFFLPFAGCPRHCVFCDQHAQTGLQQVSLQTALCDLEGLLASQSGCFGLGFFGGTFTGLDSVWQQAFLHTAEKYRRRGTLEHLRISTRPDRIDAQILTLLQSGGVDMVELGVQTFDDHVLAGSGRGYTGAQAAEACLLVREKGLSLGIQLLPGLPGHDPVLWRRDVLAVLQHRPQTVRIYPCVVMLDTELAAMHARGEFVPWSLETAVREVGWAVQQCWEAGIRVIRMGLAGEQSMVRRLVAGPWHPAFGNMVRSEVLLRVLTKAVGDGCLRALHLPRRLSGDLWGHRRCLAPDLARLGIIPENISIWNDPDIGLDMEES